MANGEATARRPEPSGGRQDFLRAALAAGDRSLNTDGDLVASRESFERAYQLAERAANAGAMAQAALGLAGLWVSERRTATGAGMLEARLQHVLPMLEERSVLALRVRARLAAEADYRRGEHEAILALLDEARAAADPVALAEILGLAHHCVLGPDDLALRRDLAVELVRTSFRTGRRSDRLMGLMWQTVDAYCAADPHAGRLLEELRGELSQDDHRAVGFIVSAIDVMLAIRAGHLDDAESLVAICAKNGVTAGDIDAEWWPGGQLVTIRWYQGRLGELLPMLEDRVYSQALSAVDNSTVVALAVAAALTGDRLTAASCLASLSGSDLADLPRSSSWLVTMNGVVEVAHLLADADVASAAYDLLLPFARLPMIGGPGVSCFGSTHQALGLASLTARELDRGIDHLRLAVQHNLALGHWPAVVSCRRRLADAYAVRDRQGDAEAAQRELDAAAVEAGALGLAVPAARAAITRARTTDDTATRDTATRDIATRGDAVAPGVATCTRVGRRWQLTLLGRSVLVEDSIGMLHLAVLIANPRREIPAADLVSGLAALRGGGDSGAGQPALDPQAVSAYRRRLKQLNAAIDELEAGDAADQAASLRVERDWIMAQLANAAGLSGRTRFFSDEGERARVAVGKAIRRALARITEADADIGDHLRQRVHTGKRCSYWPG
ncbi:MAG TPA: hypothetical protein VMA72_13545 [Streptosporangiaceae bacterium]|nr:hypothetical protein [Streptosporangiaceae bacterium]